MTKAFRNLIIILLICLIATGISITASPILNNSMSPVSSNNNITEIWLTSNITDTTIHNPEFINISCNSKVPADLSFTNQYLFNVIIYNEENIFKEASLNKVEQDPFSIKIDKAIPYVKKLDISQSTLNLPNGEYKISISPNIDDHAYNIKPLILHISYLSNIPYISAISETPKGKMPISLYFSNINNNIRELVGITRFVDTTRNHLNTTIAELQKGPKIDIGLSIKPPIGKVEYITTVNNITYINLSSKEKIYTSNPIESEIAMKSFIKSLSSIQGVNRIKFLVDNKKASTFFNGKDVSNSIKYKFENKVYLGLNSYKRYFLVDCNVKNINEKMTVNEKVEKIGYELKNKNVKGLFNTIPKDVYILDYNLTKDTLSLNFNENFLISFNNNQNLQKMMIDAIVFSFTSLNDVNYIDIKVEGNNVDNFAGMDISKPLKKPLYINPENY